MATISATAGTGWFDDFVTLKVNGVETPNNYYIGTNPGTGTAFDGAAFGTVTSLEMSDINLKYWADNGDTRDGGALYYKIMSADGSTQIVAPVEIVWAHSFISGNNYQGSKPGYVSGSMSFLRGLPTGSYQLHIWAKSWGAGGDSYLSNAGANYVATFSVVRPVTVSGTQRSIDNTYETLKQAFDSINFYQDHGNKDIEIKIAGNTTEIATAALNQPTTASWTSLTIYPTATATISGSFVGTILDLNGADNVTINGKLNKTGAAKSLTISHTSNADNGNRTIRLWNDAKNNTIQYCNITGKCPSSGAGVIFLGDAKSTLGEGNDNNIFEYNDINAAGAANGIKASSANAFPSEGNIIRNNNIFDFYISNTSTTATAGIDVSTNYTTTTITDNSLYQTASREYAATAVIHLGINVGGASNGNTISGNYIGGSAALCGGTAWTVTGGLYRLWAIQTSVGFTNTTNVQGNVIANIDITTGFVGGGSSAFIGYINNYGLAEIGTTTGNTIGSTTQTGSIKVKFTGLTVGSLVVGISLITNKTSVVGDGGISTSCSNNKIGGIITDLNNSTNRAHLYAVSVSGGGTLIFTNNTIGSTTVANSIEHKGCTYAGQVNLRGLTSGNSSTLTCTGNTIANLTATSTAQMTVNGIYHNGAGSNSSISNNIIRDLKSYGVRTSAGSGAAMIGILFAGNSNTNTIGNNTIYSLNNATTTADGVEAYGIFFESINASASTIEKNKIYGITTASTNTNANIIGVYISNGLTNTQNNMISLGNGLTTAYNMSGIRKSNTKANNFYHNSVVLSGTEVGVAGTTNTYAFYKTGSGTDVLKNNILINSRSNATGNLQKHYVLNVNDLTTFTSDYNIAYHPGVGGKLGAVGATDYTTGMDWSASIPTGTGQDVNSRIGNVNFTNAANGDLTITGLSLQDNMLRVPILAAVTTDILGKVRDTEYTYAGAHESTLPFLTTGIDKALMQAGVQISKTGIFIPVNGTSNIELYTMNGTLIDKAVVNSSYNRSLNNGAYIVKINGKAVKFVK